MSNNHKCWIVWLAGHPDSYRCFNFETPEEAVEEYQKKYGTQGRHTLSVSERSQFSKDVLQFEVTFEIKKK